MKRIFIDEPLTGVIIVAAILLVIGFIGIGIWSVQEQAKADAMHQVGVYACPECGSRETSGHTTYWTNDGMYVQHKDLADYTLFSCDYCNHGWKVDV